MRLEPKKSLENSVATRIRQTYRDPAEWVVYLRNGEVCHIVADKSNLRVARGKELNESLRKQMKGDVEFIKHKHVNRKVDTETMVRETGLNLGEGVEVNSSVPGDVDVVV